MDGLICFLEKWQRLIGPLVGALIGGCIGLLAALLVARDAREREQRAAAMLLVSDLAKIKISSEVLNEIMKEKGEAAEPFAWKIDRLTQGRPILSPLFESSMVRIMPLDNHLAAHLSLFRNCYSEIDRDLNKLETYINTYKMTGNLFLKKEEFDSYSGLILRNFERAVHHAIWAAFLLDKLILRRWALFHRLFRQWKRPKDEKESRELLEKGSGKKQVS